jgi:acetolactate synthase regulatory subunit
MLNLSARSETVSAPAFVGAIPLSLAGLEKAHSALRGNAAPVAQQPRNTDRKSVDREAAQSAAASASRRAARYRMEAMNKTAAEILGRYELAGAKAVHACGQVIVAGGAACVKINVETRRTAFGGLQRCGSVWLCCACSRATSQFRAAEVNRALEISRKEGFSVCLMTLTVRHDSGMALAPLLRAMKRAKQRFGQLRAYRNLKALIVGSITATEVTHGARHGWHPHQHVLMFMSCSEAEALKLLGGLRKAWLGALKSFGLSGGKAALDVRGGTAAGNYVSKAWGAAEELTLGTEKSGRSGGRTPMQLLADASDGCRKSAGLWAEYAAAFHGLRQLVWSAGLKDRFKIQEVSDAQAAENDAATEKMEVVRVFTSEEWAVVRLRKCAVRRAVERGASIDAAMAGPTDAEIWRRLNGPIWER